MRAGARETIYYNPAEVTAAIVTCGGLCPGLNDVVQGLVRKLEDYGVPEGNILGIRCPFGLCLSFLTLLLGQRLLCAPCRPHSISTMQHRAWCTSYGVPEGDILGTGCSHAVHGQCRLLSAMLHGADWQTHFFGVGRLALP